MKFSKLILSLACIIGVSFVQVAKAQTETLEERIDQTQVNTEEAPAPAPIQYPIELQVSDSRDGKFFNIKLEDPAIVEQRLKSIQNIMPMVYNENVKKYIDFFLIQRPSFTQEMMEKKNIYFPTFEAILRQNDMPEELKYLSLLESGLNPKAVSRSKAVGLWQFMSFTGKEMGLAINPYIDERMDIEKSTQAACQYLKTLYNRFYDWDLALASYNTGPGRISRTIKSTGLSNYWDLHPHIHPDTRAYVPQFIALAYLMNFGQDHGILPDKITDATPTQKIANPGYLDLKVLSDLSGIDLAEIHRLNPQYKTDILPESLAGYEVALPVQSMAYFNTNRNEIMDSATKRAVIVAHTAEDKEDSGNVASNNTNTSSVTDSDVNTKVTPLVIGGKKTRLNVPELVVRNEDDAPKYKNITKEVKKIHKVKRGEVLNRISEHYDVTMSDIKKWNNKKSSQVNVGERLTIYVKETQKVNANSVAAKSSSENIRKSDYYTVKPGDTLWNISQRYDGVSVNEIKKWNNIKGNSVKVGQKIKVRA